MSNRDSGPGPRQHYIPASRIGMFSKNEDGALRKRRIWVMRERKEKPYPNIAENVGIKTNLYNFDNEDAVTGDGIDNLWSYMERNLKQAIEQLESYSSDPEQQLFDVETWATVIVPFVAQSFVRNLDFGNGLSRGLFTFERSRSDDLNHQRIIELQLTRSYLLGQDWCLLRNTKKVPFILNDFGYCYTESESGRKGFYFPLNKNLLLAVVKRDHPCIDLSVFADSNGIKKIYLPVADLPEDTKEINEGLAIYAKNEIYGPNSEVVSDAWAARKSSLEGARIGLDLFRPSKFPMLQWMDEYEQFLRTLGISEEVIRSCMGGYKMQILKGFEKKPVKASIIKQM